MSNGNGIGNHGAALFEGRGAGLHSGVLPAVEEAGSNPFGGNVPNAVHECLRIWLGATEVSRFTPGAIHNLKETLTRFPEGDVKSVIQDSFCRSDQEAIKMGLEAAGLVKKRAPILQEVQDAEPDTPEQLLREAVLYLPPLESALRERIERYLADA